MRFLVVRFLARKRLAAQSAQVAQCAWTGLHPVRGALSSELRRAGILACLVIGGRGALAQPVQELALPARRGDHRLCVENKTVVANHTCGVWCFQLVTIRFQVPTQSTAFRAVVHIPVLRWPCVMQVILAISYSTLYYWRRPCKVNC